MNNLTFGTAEEILGVPTGKMYHHLQQRHLSPYLYHNISITPELVTFPLWNVSGQMVGYQQYNPNGSKQERRNPKECKYFTYISEGKNNTAWGLDVLNPNQRLVVLVEGIFKACRFHNHGINALAVLGNNPKHLYSWLHSMGYYLFAICDGDEAGRKLAKFGHSSIQLRDGYFIDEISEDSLRVDIIEHFYLKGEY
jgi:hypothetical protein